MNDASQPLDEQGAAPPTGTHLTTISHEGRFWEVYLEFLDDPGAPDSYRALFRFAPADQNEGETPTRTAPIIIEYSYEEAVAKARSFNDRQLSDLLRSTLPE